MKASGSLLLVLFFFLVAAHGQKVIDGVEEPQQVDPCTLANNPPAYNHKLVELDGYITHAFEDFTFNVPCKAKTIVWLEYGGKQGSNTMICCGVSPKAVRPKDMVVEGISVPLIADDTFTGFNSLLNQEYDTIIKARIVGRYFAGKQSKYGDNSRWDGYGHMGIGSLLVIQQVKAFELHSSSEFDYRATADQPKADEVGCGYSYLGPDRDFGDDISYYKDQLKDSDPHDPPFEVAKKYLLRNTPLSAKTLSGLKEIRKAQGRHVYQIDLPLKKGLMVVVSRPYMLAKLFTNPSETPWVAVAGYSISCDGDNEVTTLAAGPVNLKKKPIKKKKRPARRP